MSERSPLIGREAERRELRALLEAGRPRLALLTGRRRVGKTFLLTHTWPEDVTFFFTASRTSPAINRRQLVEDLARWSGEDLAPEEHPTWRSVFRLLLGFRHPDPLVVVLDEFPYLATDDRGLAEVASELNAVWERDVSPRRLVLVLAGSSVSAMEALDTGGAPLYGRFDWRGRLAPFDAWHAAQAAPFPDLRDRVHSYAIFGGTPRYLAALDPEEGLRRNGVRLALSPRGEIRQLVETALDQEDALRDVPAYYAVLRAVAGGATQRNEIAQHAGLKNDTSLRHRLDRLVHLGYLAEQRTFGARPNTPARYAILDAALRFHHRFVEPNRSLLERADPDEVWTELVDPHLDTFTGPVFERVAREAYDRLRADRGLPLVRGWRNWEGTDREGRSVEIDLVGRTGGGTMVTGSVKWMRAPIGARIHFDHLEMLRRLAAAGRGWAREALRPDAYLYYVAAGGFTDGFRAAVAEAEQPVVAWDLTDVYAEAEGSTNS